MRFRIEMERTRDKILIMKNGLNKGIGIFRLLRMFILIEIVSTCNAYGQYELWVKELNPIDSNFVECLESVSEQLSGCLYCKKNLPSYCIIEEDSVFLTITQRQGYWQNDLCLLWASGYFRLGEMTFIVDSISDSSHYKTLGDTKIMSMPDTNSYVRHPFLIGIGLDINENDGATVLVRKQAALYDVECQIDCIRTQEDCPNLKARNFYYKKNIVIKSPFVKEQMFGQCELLVHFDNIRNLKVLNFNVLGLSIWNSRQKTSFSYYPCTRTSRTEEAEYYSLQIQNILPEIPFKVRRRYKQGCRQAWKRDDCDDLTIKQWKISNWEPILLEFIIIPMD